MYKSQAELLGAIIQSIPNSDKIKDIDLQYQNYVMFTYFFDRFSVSLNGNVEMAKGNMLESNNTTSFLTELLKVNRK